MSIDIDKILEKGININIKIDGDVNLVQTSGGTANLGQKRSLVQRLFGKKDQPRIEQDNKNNLEYMKPGVY